MAVLDASPSKPLGAAVTPKRPSIFRKSIPRMSPVKLSAPSFPLAKHPSNPFDLQESDLTDEEDFVDDESIQKDGLALLKDNLARAKRESVMRSNRLSVGGGILSPVKQEQPETVAPLELSDDGAFPLLNASPQSQLSRQSDASDTSSFMLMHTDHRLMEAAQRVLLRRCALTVYEHFVNDEATPVSIGDRHGSSPRSTSPPQSPLRS